MSAAFKSRRRYRHTVIMAPELLPVTNTLLASPLYFWSVYVTMLAIELESPYFDQHPIRLKQTSSQCTYSSVVSQSGLGRDIPAGAAVR